MKARRLLCCALLAAAPAAAQDAPREWIDVHAHLIGRGGGVTDYAGAVGTALRTMDEAGITLAVVMPPPQTRTMSEPYDIEALAAAVQSTPRRFRLLGGGGSLNVILSGAGEQPGAAALSDFERRAEALLDRGALGFGEIAAHHLSHAPGHPYQWSAPDHPLLLRLADVAARRGVPIELHLDLVTADMPTPARIAGFANPAVLRANLAAFERLLAHDRRAAVIWAHAGSDALGFRTAALCRELLERHSNLYMSLRMPAGVPPGAPLLAAFATDGAGRANPDWIRLVSDFPERFVIGGDDFFASPALRGAGPGLQFARLVPRQTSMIRQFLAALPVPVARSVASGNAERLYRLQR